MENQNSSDTPAPPHEPGQVIGPSASAPPVSPTSSVPPVAPVPAAPLLGDRPAAVAAPLPQSGLMVNGQIVSYNEQKMAGPKTRLNLKPSKKLLVPVLVALVLLGGGAAAYFGYVVPNKPNNVLAKSVKNTLASHQVTINGLLDATSSGISGRVDYTAKIDADNHATDITLNTMVSGVQFPVEVLTAKGNLFFKIGDLSTIEGLINGFAGGSSDIGKIKQIENKVNTKVSNQWIEVDNTLIKEAKLGCLANYPAVITQADIGSLENSYKKAQFATVSNHSADTVNGTKSVKYDVQINDDKMAAMDIGGVGAVHSLNSCLQFFDKTSMLNLNSLKDGKQHTLSLWVDSSAKKINKFAASFKDGASGDETALSGTISYGGINIQTPSKSIQLLNLLSDLGLGNFISDTVNTFGGVQQKAKDTERQTDINAIQSQLEVYFTDNGYYPTASELSSPTWRKANLKGEDEQAFKDPDGSGYTLASTPTKNIYAYQTTPTACAPTQCQHYTLTATLSTGATYAKQSLN